MLPHDQTVSKPVFNLKPHYNVFAYASVNFEIIGSLSFMINRATGEIYLREKIPDNSKEWIRTVNISVDVVDELGIQLKGITHVTFVVLPMFPGESYVTSNILDSVANQIEKKTLEKPKNQSATVSHAGLHRMLRTSSEKTQEISKSKLYFDEVFETVHQKVEKTYNKGLNNVSFVLRRFFTCMTFFKNLSCLGARSRVTLRKFWSEETQLHLLFLIKAKGGNRGTKPQEKLYSQGVHQLSVHLKYIFLVSSTLTFLQFGKFWSLLGVLALFSLDWSGVFFYRKA